MASVSFKTVSGESSEITFEITAPWRENTLPKILLRYKLELNLTHFFVHSQTSSSIFVLRHAWKENIEISTLNGVAFKQING